MVRKILVTGSRHHTNRNLIWDELGNCDPDHLVHGAALGADTIADTWAKQIPSVKISPHPADWSYGKGAGPIRNAEMLKAHPDIDLVLAFPLDGSVGTWDMVDRAIAAKINVKVVFR